MKTSERGIDLIKHFEGFAPSVYLCPAGKKTVGYGHVVRDGEGFTHPLTEYEATELLITDLTKRYEPRVLEAVDVPLTQGQFDALVSFCYNLGPAALETSTLLSFLNLGDYEKAAGQFTRWNKAAGKVLDGLTKRREAERDLFLSA